MVTANVRSDQNSSLSFERLAASQSNNSFNNATTTTENEFVKTLLNVLIKQVSRIESKMNKIQSTVSQVQQIVISYSDVHLPEPISELPLSTTESLDKFEIDLNDKEYSEQVVSIDYYRFFTLMSLMSISLFSVQIFD